MEFDPTKPVQTRDGRPARVLGTDLETVSGETIVAAIKSFNGDAISTFFANGRLLSEGEHRSDLVNIPEKHVRWLAIAGTDPVSHLHATACTSEEDARQYLRLCRHPIACIRIEFSEGDGL